MTGKIHQLINTLPPYNYLGQLLHTVTLWQHDGVGEPIHLIHLLTLPRRIIEDGLQVIVQHATLKAVDPHHMLTPGTGQITGGATVEDSLLNMLSCLFLKFNR